jgi:hypothetical protein
MDDPLLTDEDPPMHSPPSTLFPQLLNSVERIARHADYPGKAQAIDQCVADVDELIVAGQITPDQGATLQAILRTASPARSPVPVACGC